MATAEDEAVARILVVEDNPQISRLLVTSLGFEGYAVEAVGDGAAGLERIASWEPDLVLLDIMLPGLDGFAVQRALAAQAAPPPVLVLSARDATVDLVRGLDLGAEDYVTKPFRIEELLARVRRILQRSAAARAAGVGAASASAPDVVAGPPLSFHDLELDEATHEVRRGGRLIDLTPREFDLLHYLLRHPGLALSKAQLLDAVWEYDFGGDAGIVETYVSYLRRKVDTVEPRLIHTVRGVGYSLRLPRDG